MATTFDYYQPTKLTSDDFEMKFNDLVDALKECTENYVKQKRKDSGAVIDDVSEEEHLRLLRSVLANIKTAKFLIALSRVDVFDNDFAEMLVTKGFHLDMLACLKKLKYFSNLPLVHIVTLLGKVLSGAEGTENKVVDNYMEFSIALNKGFMKAGHCHHAVSPMMRLTFKEFLKQKEIQAKAQWPKKILELYSQNNQELEQIDPHAIYPTSIYRRCEGKTFATPDSQTIEAVMSTSITTTIKITNNVLDPVKNQLLAEVYKPFGRVVAIVDDKVEACGYVEQLKNYFKYHDVNDINVLIFGGNEIDKDMSNVEKILVALKKTGAPRNEPVLIAAGGVLGDLAGFACALYHRNTPYVMLCTSIVAGIDAGPSPRTCCDGFGYKNLYGAYHPPVLTLTDRMFWKTLRTGWVRHGIAEIVKMACVKDLRCFELLEEASAMSKKFGLAKRMIKINEDDKVGSLAYPNILVDTKFGTEFSDDLLEELSDTGFDNDYFQQICDEIVGRAMDGYVRSEYGNLWETHQCRPHAFGHTWSPGYELPAGMLHGHAVATCMGFGAYLAWKKMNWISETDMNRILGLISSLELALWHPIMKNHKMIYSAQVKMKQKRGGNLAAPVPRGVLGKCGYINELSEVELGERLTAYHEYVLGKGYARNGLGVEMHCHEVGLQDPSSVIKPGDLDTAHKATPVSQTEQPENYNEWIKLMQEKRHAGREFSILDNQKSEPHPPPFAAFHLFANETVERYAISQTSPNSAAIRTASKITEKEDMFMPCMVGAIESQFLKLVTQISGAQKILDVGTFTGMSAIAFAESSPDAQITTLEFDETIAKTAQRIFDAAGETDGKFSASQIELIQGDAKESMKKLRERGEKYDLIFLDADKETYSTYYDLALGDNENDGLLAEGGFLLADNSLCALLYDQKDFRSQALHEFNQKVQADPRVEQVVLTVREGVTLIRRKNDPSFRKIAMRNAGSDDKHSMVQAVKQALFAPFSLLFGFGLQQ